LLILKEKSITAIKHTLKISLDNTFDKWILHYWCCYR